MEDRENNWRRASCPPTTQLTPTLRFEREQLASLNAQALARTPTDLHVYPLARRVDRFPFVSPQAQGFVLGGLSFDLISSLTASAGRPPIRLPRPSSPASSARSSAAEPSVVRVAAAVDHVHSEPVVRKPGGRSSPPPPGAGSARRSRPRGQPAGTTVPVRGAAGRDGHGEGCRRPL